MLSSQDLEENPGMAAAPEDEESLPAPPADEAQEEAEVVGEAVGEVGYNDDMVPEHVPPADDYDLLVASQQEPIPENDIPVDSLETFGEEIPNELVNELPMEYPQLGGGHEPVGPANECLAKAEHDLIEIEDSPCLGRKASSANLGEESRSLRHGLPSTFSDTLSAAEFESYKEWLGIAKQRLDVMTKDRFAKQLDSKLFKLS